MIVSTDDVEISEIAISASVEIQAKNLELADEHSTTLDVKAA